MHIVALTAELTALLSTVDRASSNSSTLPALKNVLIETDGDQLVCTATNLELALRATGSAKVHAAGKVSVPLAVLLQTLAAIPDDRVTLQVIDQTLVVTAPGYEGKLTTAPVEDFPLIPTRDQFITPVRMSGTIFRDVLSRVVIAAQSTSDLSPALASVLMVYTIDTLTIVATDSFRLAEYRLPHSQFSTDVGEPFTVLVPSKTIVEIVRIMKDDVEVSMYIEPTQISFETDRWQCVSRRIDATFPEYAAIIPQTFTSEVTLDRDELLQALKAALVLVNKQAEIKMSVATDTLTLHVAHESLGTTTVRVPCIATASIDGLLVNGRYLVDGLKALPIGTVMLGLNEERPALFKGVNDGSYRYLLAPLLGR